VISEAYRRHVPIVGPKKSVLLAYYVYIDDEALLENGRLPTYAGKIGPYGKGRVWLSSQPALYPPGAPSKKKRGKACVLELRRNGRFMPAPRMKSLPEHCQAPGS
jgi:hypothetical protein